MVSKNHKEPPKVAQLAKNCPILSPSSSLAIVFDVGKSNWQTKVHLFTSTRVVFQLVVTFFQPCPKYKNVR
jgi:hypothetical protein